MKPRRAQLERRSGACWREELDRPEGGVVENVGVDKLTELGGAPFKVKDGATSDETRVVQIAVYILKAHSPRLAS